MSFPRTLHLFCRVVDNYGDIGICWRLARQLQQEYGIGVTLFVDDLASFRRLCPEVNVDADVQEVSGVTVRHWRDQESVFSAADVADIVIEFFAVDIPPGYIAAMAACDPQPVWLNLEGLTAETWVEGCHTLPSSHPRLPLTKYFFFPGFTDKTGGLLCEAGLDAQRQAFQSDPANAAHFLAGLGVPPQEFAALKVSLFCYPHAPVGALFDAWQHGEEAITCLVPEGVASDAVRAFLDAPPVVGAVRTRDALTVRVLPFVAQPDYDRLLWSCDINFVRGEDSWVRAQWAGKPFVWHIYPQDENLHHVKLRAFLQRYAGDGANDRTGLSALMQRWNGMPVGDENGPPDWQELWKNLQQHRAQIVRQSTDWQRKMQENGDLAANLLKFARRLRAEDNKNSV